MEDSILQPNFRAPPCLGAARTFSGEAGPLRPPHLDIVILLFVFYFSFPRLERACQLETCFYTPEPVSTVTSTHLPPNLRISHETFSYDPPLHPRNSVYATAPLRLFSDNDRHPITSRATRHPYIWFASVNPKMTPLLPPRRRTGRFPSLSSAM